MHKHLERHSYLENCFTFNFSVLKDPDITAQSAEAVKNTDYFSVEG